MDELRPSSHGNAIVPFHLRSNFWNGLIGCSHGNGTIVYQFCFVFRRERNRSVDMFSICLFRRERNRTIAYCPTFHITFSVVSLFGTERFYLTKWNDCTPMCWIVNILHTWNNFSFSLCVLINWNPNIFRDFKNISSSLIHALHS